MACNHKFRIEYDPPITWELFAEHRDRKEFLCEKCNTPCEAIGQFNNIRARNRQQEQVPGNSGINGYNNTLCSLEAKRKHAGTWTIIGKIVTVSNMYVIEIEQTPQRIQK